MGQKDASVKVPKGCFVTARLRLSEGPTWRQWADTSPFSTLFRLHIEFSCLFLFFKVEIQMMYNLFGLKLIQKIPFEQAALLKNYLFTPMYTCYIRTHLCV